MGLAVLTFEGPSAMPEFWRGHYERVCQAQAFLQAEGLVGLGSRGGNRSGEGSLTSASGLLLSHGPIKVLLEAP